MKAIGAGTDVAIESAGGVFLFAGLDLRPEPRENLVTNNHQAGEQLAEASIR